jgi:hypothetical protein
MSTRVIARSGADPAAGSVPARDGGHIAFQGFYHWSQVVGIAVDPNELFEYRSIAWQTATVFLR